MVESLEKDILGLLKEHSCIDNVEHVDSIERNGRQLTNGSDGYYRLDCLYENTRWKLLLGMRENFPNSLPTVYLENHVDYRPMGHVDWFGGICYKDKQGLVIDRHNPDTVLYDCIYEALRTLHINNSDQERIDLQMEFEDYWEGMPGAVEKTWCFIEARNEICEISAYKRLPFKQNTKKKKVKIPKSWIVLADPEHETNKSYSLKNVLENKNPHPALYIPLESPVDPPGYGCRWTVTNFIDEISKRAKPDIWSDACEWAKKQKWRSSFLIVLSHPKPDSSFAMWSVELKRRDTAPHPFVGQQLDWKVEALRIRRHSKEYLLARGGGTLSFHDKKVLVIGCGSVGGTIAFQLAKSGVGELALADPDTFEAENIYRHIMGGGFLGEHDGRKVFALSWMIEHDIPYISVTPYTDTLLSVLDSKSILKKYDAVVVATGEFTHELAFNEKLKNDFDYPPVVYAWQDGFGIGGHAIRVSAGDPGCLECLYTTTNGRKLHPKTSFIGEDQTISKHMGGCSGVFTPYSFNDATHTAVIATRLVIEALQGDTKSTIRSWKGSSAELEANGYQPSHWYKQSQGNDLNDSKNFIEPDCPICGTHTQIQSSGQ